MSPGEARTLDGLAHCEPLRGRGCTLQEGLHFYDLWPVGQGQESELIMGFHGAWKLLSWKPPPCGETSPRDGRGWELRVS